MAQNMSRGYFSEELNITLPVCRFPGSPVSFACKMMGADLLSVHSSEELDFIREHINKVLYAFLYVHYCFVKQMTTFIQQGCIKLIKKRRIILQKLINSVLLTFVFMKENIKQLISTLIIIKKVS